MKWTLKTKARFGHLQRPPAWKRRGPILVSALHKFVTYLLSVQGPTWGKTLFLWTHCKTIFNTTTQRRTQHYCNGNDKQLTHWCLNLFRIHSQKFTFEQHNQWYKSKARSDKPINLLASTIFKSATYDRRPPSPPTDNIRAMVIVWRVRGEIIWPTLCCCAS